ncbi:MAG: two pore domain potassium channel family protein [Acidobacteria bacterium]|nr:two pore domain potassium channel family protein [Acidobacteriota bacterium]
MFERHHEPLLPLPRFFGRMAKSLGIAATINGVTLAMGAVGLRRLEGLDWMDACLNAALVMTGNGPIARAQSVSGKTFLLFYALGGVLVFAAVIASVMAPILHRMLHAFHADVPDEASGRQAVGRGN